VVKGHALFLLVLTPKSKRHTYQELKCVHYWISEFWIVGAMQYRVVRSSAWNIAGSDTGGILLRSIFLGVGEGTGWCRKGRKYLGGVRGRGCICIYNRLRGETEQNNQSIFLQPNLVLTREDTSSS
jgi:hypothetical protein